MDLESGLTTKAYTFTNAASGATYSFRVQARNSVGSSDYSNTLEIIAGTVPSTPDAPTTTLSDDASQV